MGHHRHLLISGTHIIETPWSQGRQMQSISLVAFNCRWLILHQPTKSSTRLLCSSCCPFLTHPTVAALAENSCSWHDAGLYLRSAVYRGRDTAQVTQQSLVALMAAVTMSGVRSPSFTNWAREFSSPGGNQLA